MKRDDRIGLGVSLGLHALLLAVFALSVAAREPEPLGLVEVEFGPIERAQPAAPAPTPRPAPTQPEPQPDPPAPRPTPPAPVDLPDRRDTPEPDRLPPPEPEETVAPPAPPQPQNPPAEPDPQEETGGNPEGEAGSSSDTGDPGPAPARRAPFDIEGLNRTLEGSPALPQNPGVRASSEVTVCVRPDGSVARAYPERLSGVPGLDARAAAAVKRWRFNRLPPAAPQAEQCGTVTFRFTLE